MEKIPEVKILEPKIPRMVQCPHCGFQQPFKKKTYYWRTVKSPHLEHPVLMRIRMMSAKCENSNCNHKSFTLPVPDIDPYQRATNKLIQEGVLGSVQDNVTLRRISQRISRSFNTTGSKSAIDRWKHRLASKYEFPDIIKRLEFSGALSLDEYMPRRSDHYEQIAGDAKKIRILYLEPVPEFYGRGVTEAFCRKIDDWGIKPYCVIFDLLTTFPKVISKVWPTALWQFDHYHIMQWLWHYLKNALIQFRKSLKGKKWEFHREELWEMKWGILRRMDRWGKKEHLLIPRMMDIYSGTVVEKVLLFKEQIWDIFDSSESKQEAYSKRDALVKQTWWQDSSHLTKCIEFLLSDKFEHMVTYLEHPEVPRCGHSETLINVWRQMESVRRGFRSPQGRSDHLKLFQITHYLKEQVL
ncbi:MAG: transposase [Deltaproteobacteria bacterium]